MSKMRIQVCRTCKEEKTIRNFYKHPTTISGYMKVCRSCHKVAIYENRELKKEAYNAKRRIRDSSPEAKLRRKLYLQRPEVKEMLKEASRFNYRIKREAKCNTIR